MKKVLGWYSFNGETFQPIIADDKFKKELDYVMKDSKKYLEKLAEPPSTQEKPLRPNAELEELERLYKAYPTTLESKTDIELEQMAISYETPFQLHIMIATELQRRKEIRHLKAGKG